MLLEGNTALLDEERIESLRQVLGESGQRFSKEELEEVGESLLTFFLVLATDAGLSAE